MSPSSEDQSRLIAASLVILAAVAIAGALAYTRAVMVPFVLAIFLSYLLAPLVDLLQERLRTPRVLGVFIALLVALGALTLLGLLIMTSTRGLLDSAHIYRDRIAGAAERAFSVLDRSGIDLGQRQLLEGIEQLPLAGVVGDAAITVLDLVTEGGLVLIFLVYLLISRQSTTLRTGIYAEIDAKIRRYLSLKIAISASTGVLVGFVLWLFGLDLALVFGVLAFFLNFIPTIGSIIATLLPLPVAIIQFDSPWLIAGVFGVPWLIQMLIGNGVEPVLMGKELELHPITVLLSLLFWGLLWGIVGMFLAVPMTAILRIVLGRIEMTRPIADLLAGRLPGSEQPPSPD